MKPYWVSVPVTVTKSKKEEYKSLNLFTEKKSATDDKRRSNKFPKFEFIYFIPRLHPWMRQFQNINNDALDREKTIPEHLNNC